MSRSRLGLEAERLGSRLGLGHEGLVSIPVRPSHSALNSMYSELKCKLFFGIVEEQRKIRCSDCVFDFC